MASTQNFPRTDSIATEVRFASVMYGGVSLAIYINGIAQELLRMVRATASELESHAVRASDPPAKKPANGPLAHKDSGRALLSEEQLDGTERVYRRIAQALEANGAWDPEALASARPGAALRTRFVVDILSGTSAGGINAVFLAKALANGESIGALANLWVDEGAIEKLVNDQGSRFDASPERELPASLLNSRRMYRKLLDAFEVMDDAKERASAAAGALPSAPWLVRDVDLFVTTTDIAGLPVALRLSDSLVSELRHRNVFHLRFSENLDGTMHNDFVREKNPFLAFVARCTSAFPFAFEPMQLQDIDSVLRYRGKRDVPAPVPDDGGEYRAYFPAYTGTLDDEGGTNEPGALGAAARAAEPWLRDGARSLATRAFGDGGYLDNKPFEYAIDAIANRHRTGIVVDRKLVYLEPSPEHPELEVEGEVPNAIENVSAALSLARYETIRGDLERVLSRNRLIERVDRIIQGVDEDIAIGDASGAGLKRQREAKDYRESDLIDLVKTHGVAYGGYHRLKVSALTDEITQYLSRVAGYNESSDEFQAVRQLVGAWRKAFFAPYFRDQDAPVTKDGRRAQRQVDRAVDDGTPDVVRSENLFLLRYDLSYRVRRLNFVLDRLERLLCVDDAAARMLEQRGFVLRRDDRAFSTAFTEKLRALHAGLVPAQILLQARRQRLLCRERGGEHGNPLAEKLDLLTIRRLDLLRILGAGSADARAALATQWIRIPEHQAALKEIAHTLAASIAEATAPAAGMCEALLPYPPIPAPDPEDGAAVAHAIARHYYHGYDRYDQLIFPAFFSTDVGEEADVIDVARFSPEDATSLIDEHANGESRRKLAGVAVGHFGGFLDRRWRWNDIMWGRLDASERLIHILLPGDDAKRTLARQALIDEAHGAILEEEFSKLDADTTSWMTDTDRARLQELLALPKEPELETRRRELRRIFRERFRANYSLKNGVGSLDPQQLSSVLARSTRVIGKMFQRMSDDYSALGRPAALLTGVGTIGWGLVEAATPQSIFHLVAMHWLKLLYLFDAVLLAVSIAVEPIRHFAFEALGVTVLCHLALLVLRDTFSRKTSWSMRLMIVAIVLMFSSIALGVAVAIHGKLRTALCDFVRTSDDFSGMLWALVIAASLCALFVAAAWLERMRMLKKRVNVEVERKLKKRAG